MSEIRVRDSLVQAPADLPFNVAYAKLHIKAISSVEDTLVASWIEAATQYFEEQTGRQIMTAIWEHWLDGFPAGRFVELPKPPLQQVVSVQYLDGNGDLQPFTDGASPEVPHYTVHAPQGTYATRGWLEVNAGLSWPSTRVETGAVRIQFVAGYGDETTDVPELIKTALLYLVGHFDQFRSEVHLTERGGKLERLPFGVQQILDGFKYSAWPTIVPRTSILMPSQTAWSPWWR